MLVDTHAHLDFTDDVEGWIKRAKENGVGKIICVGTNVDASRKCVEIAQKYSSKDSGQALRLHSGQLKGSESYRTARMTKAKGLKIYATVGIHAQDGKGDIDKFGSLDKSIDELKQILRSAQDDKTVVGVGECGFDFKVTSYKLQVISDKEEKFQKELFEAQVELAVELKLPLVVHCRNAWKETFDLLRRFSTRSNNKLRGLFHSWTGDWEAAQKALDLGFYISFSGIVTFKNAPNVQEVTKKMPLEKMFLETDSPFLSPEPLRGKQNEPKNVKIIAEFIARLRDLPVDRLTDVTSKNAGRLFGFKN